MKLLSSRRGLDQLVILGLAMSTAAALAAAVTFYCRWKDALR